MFKKIFIRTIPVLAGYLVLGIGFGILFSSKGYGLLWSFLMSAFIYAGSMQYVGVDLIATGAGFISTALTTVAVNARHLFYGIAMIDRYKKVKKKPYLIFGLTDETFSLVCQDETLTDKELFLITVLNHSYWILGSLIGSLFGTFIPWDFKGIDFAMTALFVCVFVDQWMKTKDHIPALAGLFITTACLLIFGKSNFLIPSMVGITVVLAAVRFIRKRGVKNE